jgi:hypothetical protein
MVIDITIEDIQNLKIHCESKISEIYDKEGLTIQQKADEASVYRQRIENLIDVIHQAKLIKQ